MANEGELAVLDCIMIDRNPRQPQEAPMSVAKVIEIISGSKKSFEDAVNQGLARATDTMSDVTGAWIKDQRVVVTNGKVGEYRVVMKVTFILKPSGGSKASKKR